MKNPNRRSLPSWVSLAATILMVTPVLPACAQAPADAHPATPALPAADKAAPAKPAPESAPSDNAGAGASSGAAAPNRAEAYYHDALAAIYEDEAINQGHPDDVTRAIEEYKYALNDDPDSPGLQNGLADLYYRTGRVDDAKATLNALLKKSPDNIAANKLLGRIYLRQLGEQSTMSSPSASSAVLNKAIAQFEKIVSLEPKDVDDRMVLGQLYTVNHQADKAENEFKTAQALEPDSEEVILNLARVYAESGNLKQAAKVIEDVPMDNRTPKMEFVLGATYQQLKDLRLSARVHDGP
jgi:Flp pilus assembly protein TadD